MSNPLEGVTVVEVSMGGFVPSGGALLAEWGADVIKVEHARTGDPQRGLTRMGDMIMGEPPIRRGSTPTTANGQSVWTLLSPRLASYSATWQPVILGTRLGPECSAHHTVQVGTRGRRYRAVWCSACRPVSATYAGDGTRRANLRRGARLHQGEVNRPACSRYAWQRSGRRCPCSPAVVRYPERVPLLIPGGFEPRSGDP